MRKIYYLGAIILGLTIASCSSSSSGDEPIVEPDVAKVTLKFAYDNNMLGVNSIESQSPSANVWAFDQNGTLVWSGSATSDKLAKDGFCVIADLPEGKYDLVTWCGLDGNNAVELAAYQPQSKEDLSVAIKTNDIGGLNVSDRNLGVLFYASVDGVAVKKDMVTDNSVTLSLIKDTKDFSVSLLNIDGSIVNPRDFSVSITDDNGSYAWDNSVLKSSSITYRPWSLDNKESRLSTGRLMADSSPRLSVSRKVDGRQVISIPILNYILLVKSYNNNTSMSNQEFLDREDTFSLSFVLGEDGNWLPNAGVTVNGCKIKLNTSEL